jgi:tetratricopeptide (TPR) repeat protein
LLPEAEAAGEVLQAARARLERDPQSVPAPARNVLAEVDRLRGDDPGVFVVNAKLVEQGAGTASILRLGPVLRELGQLRTLARMNRSWWDRQTLQVQDSIASWNEAAWDALNAADLDAAADAIEEVRRKAPNEIQTLVLEAYFAYQKRDFRAAQEQVKLLREDAKLNDPWKWVVKQIDVLTRLELGEKIDIEKAFPVLPATNPLSNGSNINRVWLQLEQGQKLPESLAAVLKSLSERPRSANWNYLHGVALLKNGQSKEAVAVLEKLRSCESTQRDPAFWQYLGEALVTIGQRDNARIAWERSLTVFPSTTAKDDRRRQQVEALLKTR